MFFTGESSGDNLPLESQNPSINGPCLSPSFTQFYPYFCPYCRNTFDNSRDLESHQNAHKKECRDALEELVTRTRREIDFLNKFGSNSQKNWSSIGQSRYFSPVLCPKPLRTVWPPQPHPPPQLTYQVNLGRSAPPAPQGCWPMRNPLVRDGANKNVYEEFLAACSRSVTNRKRGFEALSADLSGLPAGRSRDAIGSNWIGSNMMRNRRFDGNEANSGGELDLTLRL